jgi:hypothetical protein
MGRQMDWESEFGCRMRSFGEGHAPDGRGISLKIRVSSGCFHREHSPRAYELIDQRLAEAPRDRAAFEYLEHESGPELLVWLGSGLALAAGVVDLVVTIVRARHEGVTKGDVPSEPLELIARTIDDEDTVREEVVLRIARADDVDRERIEALFRDATVRVVGAERSD